MLPLEMDACLPGCEPGRTGATGPIFLQHRFYSTTEGIWGGGAGLKNKHGLVNILLINRLYRGVQNRRHSEEMPLLDLPPGLAAPISVWLRVTSGKRADGKVRLQPPGSPRPTWTRTHSLPWRRGEQPFCEGVELFGEGWVKERGI